MSIDRPAPAGSARRVLLVGWDSADWKVASPLIDAGRMPHLANLVSQGSAGNLASQPPYLSPMLWNSIATGKRPHRHGILGFAQTDPQTGRLVPTSSRRRKCRALWNILSERGLLAHVVGWYASHPAENITGVCVSEIWPCPPRPAAPWPVVPGTVHPPGEAAGLADLRVRPGEVDREIIRLLIPRLDEIDLKRDRRPAILAERLAELYTLHNTAIALLDRGPCDFIAVYFHFIDWVCHDFMDFHPPRRPQIAEKEFGFYQDVVSGAYQLQDLLLGDLLKHAGDGITAVVCSDHGFHSDEHRPVRLPRTSLGMAMWHRHQGLIALAGPGIKSDRLLQGASQLDVAPTVLNLFGLPVGADMDGRALTDALTAPDEVPPAIPSWETASMPYPRSRHAQEPGDEETAGLQRQFADLGYIKPVPGGLESVGALNDRLNQWSLAVNLRHAGDAVRALPILEELHFARPEDPRYAFQLALTQLDLGLVDEARATAETLLDYTADNARANLLLARIALGQNDAVGALELVRAAATQAPGHPGIAAQRGLALLGLQRWAEAGAAFHEALGVDAEDASAWLGMARAQLRAGQAAEAARCAREALGLDPGLALAAWTLGQAQMALKQPIEAEGSFVRALALEPRLKHARRALDQLQGRPFVAPDLEDRRPAELVQRRADATARLAQRIKDLELRRVQREPVSEYAPAKEFARPVEPNTGLAAESAQVIVSGLPRSGTSLMMQMLARGGLKPMTDGVRVADASNPAGYLEWEEITRLPQEPELIGRAAGRAVKVVCPLLPHLPGTRRYKIIFMLRPEAEVARSQEKMRLARAGVAEARPALSGLGSLLGRHASGMLAALRAADNIELLTVDYPQLVADPRAGAARVAGFLGLDVLPQAREMAAAVQPELYRERGDGTT